MLHFTAHYTNDSLITKPLVALHFPTSKIYSHLIAQPLPRCSSNTLLHAPTARLPWSKRWLCLLSIPPQLLAWGFFDQLTQWILSKPTSIGRSYRSKLLSVSYLLPKYLVFITLFLSASCIVTASSLQVQSLGVLKTAVQLGLWRQPIDR